MTLEYSIYYYNIYYFSDKKSCPGELLARHEAVLFLGTLIQQFSILPPEGQSSINDRGMVIIVNAPEPFKVRLVARASGASR